MKIFLDYFEGYGSFPGIKEYFEFWYFGIPDQSLGENTPAEIYAGRGGLSKRLLDLLNERQAIVHFNS